MRYVFTLVLFSLGLSWSYSQSNFKVIKDAPEDCANLWINFELLQFDLNMNNYMASNIGVGGNVIFQIKNRFGIEAAARHSYASLNGIWKKAEPRFQVEAGGYFNFYQYRKVKTMSYAGYRPQVTKLKSIGVRAGYAMNTESYVDRKHKFSSSTGDYAYKFTGFYAGLLFTSQYNNVINTDKGSNKGTSAMKKIYIDFLMFPARSMTDRTNGVPVANFSPVMFGGRVGIEKLFPEKKNNFGGASYIKYELGYRPFDGLYFMFTYGISWKDKFGKLNGYQPVREKE